jgi:outer membrane biosynthesis protein TonB
MSMKKKEKKKKEKEEKKEKEKKKKEKKEMNKKRKKKKPVQLLHYTILATRLLLPLGYPFRRHSLISNTLRRTDRIKIQKDSQTDRQPEQLQELKLKNKAGMYKSRARSSSPLNSVRLRPIFGGGRGSHSTDRDSSVGIAARYGLHGTRIEFR